MRLSLSVICIVLLMTGTLFGQNDDPEVFLSPSRVTNFAEQQLVANIKAHKRGNLADAAAIQRRLARYYSDLGDEQKASICDERANAAEAAGKPKGTGTAKISGNSSNDSLKSRSDTAPASAGRPSVIIGKPSGWSGNYYGMDAGALQKWSFGPNGIFSHEVIASGSGTGVRNQEKGVFSVSGNTLELTIVKRISAYSTPGTASHGRQTTQLGSGSETTTETRRMKIEFIGEKGEKGIVLDGKLLKVRSWN